MKKALRKMAVRSANYLKCAISWHSDDGQFAPSVWLLIAGAIYLLVSFAHNVAEPTSAFAGICLLATLILVCAIDARFGIIPDSFVFVIAVGGLIFASCSGTALWEERLVESILALTIFEAFRRSYRRFRGFDGLGFGDVKLLAAGTLWVGLTGIPSVLLVAVASALGGLLILKAQGATFTGKHAIPFGPHLAAGLWYSWLVGSFQSGLWQS